MTAFTLCEECGTTIGDGAAHWRHDDGCDVVTRAMGEMCRCVGTWVCASCCPDEVCSPLARRLQEAREEDRARTGVA